MGYFVIDLLIGNEDRHLENWGIAKLPNGDTTISPVYDCGSCFFPLYSKEEVEELLSNKTELKIKLIMLNQYINLMVVLFFIVILER